MVNPMHEGYWKKKITQSIKDIGKKKLITKIEEEKLIKKLKGK
jgi:hypothetical protein